MRVRLFLGIVLVLVICSSGFCAGVAASKDAEQASFAKLTGREVVVQLQDEKARPRAYYELWRRAYPGKDEGFAVFALEHTHVEAVVCPQGDDRSPLYVVLSGEKEEGSPKRRHRFPWASGMESGKFRQRPLVEVFTAEGVMIDPFDGNNLLDGVMADLNGDGLIERAGYSAYGIEGRHSDVLSVVTIKAKPAPLFQVLLNWNTRDWTFRLADRDGDGVLEIEAGPIMIGGLKPKVSWKWDAVKKTYVGPQGGEGDHFRVLQNADVWKELNRFKAADLRFADDPDAIKNGEAGPYQEPPPAKPPEPYRYTSLRGATDAELFHFMAAGKSEFEQEAEKRVEDVLPDNFWTADSRAAALAFVEANRTVAHRGQFRLKFDERDHRKVPARCGISFASYVSGQAGSHEAGYFLRVDPRESYLAYAEATDGFGGFSDQAAFDLRLCRVPYKDARHLAEVIWWLNRLRVHRAHGDAGLPREESQQFQGGQLTMRAEGRAIIERAGPWWVSGLEQSSRGWTGDEAERVSMSFATNALTVALPARLGEAWSEQALAVKPGEGNRPTAAQGYTEAERKRLRAPAIHFLGWWSPQQERISNAITAISAKLSQAFEDESTTERLRRIAAKLGPERPVKRSAEAISDEQLKLPDWSLIKDPKERKAVTDRWDALEGELAAISLRESPDHPDHLRQTLDLVLGQLEVMNDAAKLQAWAISKSEEAAGAWALERLEKINAELFRETLEALVRKLPEERAGDYFRWLEHRDEARAKAFARTLPPEKKEALVSRDSELLEEAMGLADEKARVAAIIEILRDPKSNSWIRSMAIDLLVPREAPLRYPEREVDSSLLALIDLSEPPNSATDKVWKALAWRGHLELFDWLATSGAASTSYQGAPETLNALAQLAKADSDRLRPKVIGLVRAHLEKTTASLPELFWVIWANDLRELKPDLEILATLSPDDYESERFGTSGGSTAMQVEGRSHLARQIVALWSEPDALTRARLLTAVALRDSYHLIGRPVPERKARLAAEMKRAAEELTPEGKKELAGFLERIEARAPVEVDQYLTVETCREVTGMVRRELGIGTN